MDDSREYLATRNAMGVVGISPDEQVLTHSIAYYSCKFCSNSHKQNFLFQDAIFRVVAAILHLGNIKFVKENETDSSEPQDDQSIFHLKTAAELLM